MRWRGRRQSSNVEDWRGTRRPSSGGRRVRVPMSRRTQGFIVPESFSHGTSEQRRAWFLRGFESGRLDSCDTFNGRV